MFQYQTKNCFVHSVLSNENLWLQMDFKQTDSKSFLTEKNKSQFVSGKYLERVSDLSTKDLEKLQLSNYQVSDNEQYYTLIQQSLKKFHKYFKEQVNTIKDHTVFLAMIEPQNEICKDVISTTTFYDYPFCTFFTKYGFKFIPPKTVFNSVNYYAIIDNLYHESLHQKLLIQILLGNIFENVNQISSPDYAINIPWRFDDLDNRTCFTGSICIRAFCIS